MRKSAIIWTVIAVAAVVSVFIAIDQIRGDDGFSEEHFVKVKIDNTACVKMGFEPHSCYGFVKKADAPPENWCNVAWAGDEPGKYAGDEPVRVTNWKLNPAYSHGGDEYVHWGAYENEQQKAWRLEHGFKSCDDMPTNLD